MEYDGPWGKLSEKQASRSKFALGRAPNRKTCWTQMQDLRDQDLRNKTCGTQSRNNGGRADDLEFR
jgi:hypothetical protein